MKTEQLKLGQIALNDRNPRTITDGKMQKLINSILVFPKMLSMRPVVIDEVNVALGGNMRLKALQAISKMTDAEITERLATLKDYNERTGGEQATLLSYWTGWLANPIVEVVQAATLTEREKKEFIIKDNVSFGQWDWTLLDKDWDTADLGDWGMDVWTPAPTEWSGNGNGGGQPEERNRPSVVCFLPNCRGKTLRPTSCRSCRAKTRLQTNASSSCTLLNVRRNLPRYLVLKVSKKLCIILTSYHEDNI